MKLTFYHHPRCSTSRRALDLLRSRGIEPVIRLYLQDPPSSEELKEVVAKLGIQAADLLRTKEPLYKEAYQGKDLSENQWLGVMSEHPVLIERPILLNDRRGVIGRPPEKVLDLLDQ